MGFLSKDESLNIPADGSMPLPVPDYIAFDLETTGLSPDDDEILEVAFIRFRDGEPVERWSTLVNPMRHVPLKTLRLTHIDIGDIEKSPVFGDISPRIVNLCESLPLVGHNASFDTAFLQKRIEGFPCVPVYDTLELSRIVVPGYHSYKLVELARAFGVSLTDAHRAYEDAEVAGKIFALIQRRILSMERRLRDAVVSIMGDSWAPRRLFLFEQGGPSMRPLLQDPSCDTWVLAPPGPRPALGSEPCQVGGPDGDASVELSARLARVLDAPDSGGAVVGVRLTAAAARAAVQAAREWASRTGGKVLLAGFPDAFLPEGIPGAAYPEDYICVRKFLHVLALASQGYLRDSDVEDLRFLASLSVWLHSSGSGDTSEVQVAGRAYAVRSEVCCPKDMPCRLTCPEKDVCRYLLAEKGLASMPVQRAGLGGALAISGGFDRVIVWGAHDLQRVWQYREDRVDLTALKETLKSEKVAREVTALSRLASLASRDTEAGRASAETKACAAEAGEQLMHVAKALRRRLEEEFGFLTAGEQKWDGRPDPPLVSVGLHYLEKASQALMSFSRVSGDHMAVVEASYGAEGQGPFLSRRSVWPAQEAVRALAVGGGVPVLLSDVAPKAGATHGGRRLFLGLESPVLDLRGVPDESTTRSELLFCGVDAKAPASGRAFAEYAAGLIRALAMRVRSGLLALFSSRAQVREVYEILSPGLEREGIVVYAQGIDGGQRVVEHLAEEDSLVLASNWASGEYDIVPTCLTVMKVPFPPPNPVDDARRKELSGAGLDGFVEVSVRPSSLMIRAYAERMLARGGKRALILADPRLSPGASKWAGEFFKAFDDLARECGPVDYLLSRVSRHLSGESES